MCWTKNKIFHALILYDGIVKAFISFMNHALLASSSIIPISQIYYSEQIIYEFSKLQCICFIAHLLFEVVYHLVCKLIACYPQKWTNFLKNVKDYINNQIKILQEITNALLKVIQEISDTEPLISNN